MDSAPADPRPKTILIVYHSQTGTVESMAKIAARGARKIAGVECRCRTARQTTPEDLLSCDGVALGTPEYFGYMSGGLKDFFDRTFETCHEKTTRLPYFLFVSAGNDGRGAIASVERIVTGYRWKKIAAPLRVVGCPSDEDLQRLDELGQTLAAGVEAGIF